MVAFMLRGVFTAGDSPEAVNPWIPLILGIVQLCAVPGVLLRRWWGYTLGLLGCAGPALLLLARQLSAPLLHQDIFVIVIVGIVGYVVIAVFLVYEGLRPDRDGAEVD